MTDIFHEVEEDLRRDKLNQLWTRYGTIFLTIAVLAVAATAGIVFWRQYEERQQGEAADAFDAATDLAMQNNADGAIAAFAAIGAQDGEGYPIISLFREASLRVVKADFQGAIAVYDRIAASVADPRLKDLARIRAAYLVSDVEAPDVLKARVADMTGDTNPWRFYAREIQAYADWRAGRAADAATAYTTLAADAAAPEGLRTRAGKLSVYINGGGTMIAPPPTAAPAKAPADPAPKPADGQDR